LLPGGDGAAEVVGALQATIAVTAAAAAAMNSLMGRT
jgi:hypothetical protein